MLIRFPFVADVSAAAESKRRMIEQITKKRRPSMRTSDESMLLK
jgi:hypothetical protein